MAVKNNPVVNSLHTRDNFESLATFHLTRWESETTLASGSLADLDLRRSTEDVIDHLCRRIGTTSTEALIAGFAFTAGMHFGKNLAEEPFDGYPKLRSAIDQFAKTVDDIHANALKDAQDA